MDKVITLIIKYRWVLIIYLIYAPIAIFRVNDEYSKREQFSADLIWLITIPLIVLILGYFIKKRWFTKKSADILDIIDPKDKEKYLFEETWSLLAFVRNYGPKFQIGEFQNKETSKRFHICVFTNTEGVVTYVYFHSCIGELTSAEIKNRKMELKVGRMVNKKYYLYDNSLAVWEDVDI